MTTTIIINGIIIYGITITTGTITGTITTTTTTATTTANTTTTTTTTTYIIMIVM